MPNGFSCGSSVTSLAAATATGAGTTYMVRPNVNGSYPLNFTWSTVTTGSPATLTVNLEGSLDNSTWFTLDSTTTTSGETRHVVNKPVLYIRANCAALTGGSSPTVTTQIAAF